MRARRQAYSVRIKLKFHCTVASWGKVLDMRDMSGTVSHQHGEESPTRWSTGSYVTFSRERRLSRYWPRNPK